MQQRQKYILIYYDKYILKLDHFGFPLGFIKFNGKNETVRTWGPGENPDIDEIQQYMDCRQARPVSET